MNKKLKYYWKLQLTIKVKFSVFWPLLRRTRFRHRAHSLGWLAASLVSLLSLQPYHLTASFGLAAHSEGGRQVGTGHRRTCWDGTRRYLGKPEAALWAKPEKRLE